MVKKKFVNVEIDCDVEEFIGVVEFQVCQVDSCILFKIMEEILGFLFKIWGVSIVGFGKYSYQCKNGDEYEWFNVGFFLGKVCLSIYLMYDVNEELELLV